MPKKTYAAGPGGVVGPDGGYCPPGEPLPATWLEHPEFDLEHLVASGGAS